MTQAYVSIVMEKKHWTIDTTGNYYAAPFKKINSLEKPLDVGVYRTKQLKSGKDPYLIS